MPFTRKDGKKYVRKSNYAENEKDRLRGYDIRGRYRQHIRVRRVQRSVRTWSNIKTVYTVNGHQMKK